MASRRPAPQPEDDLPTTSFDDLKNRIFRERGEGQYSLEILPADQRTPEYLAKYLADDVARWKKVIIQAGIPVD